MTRRSIPTTVLPVTVGIDPRPESRAHTSVRAKALTAEHLGDPASVARELNELRDELRRVTLAARVSPLLQANLIRRISFTSGTAIDVEHLLDRAWSEFAVVGQMVAALGARAISVDSTFDRRFIRLVPNATGVASVLVW